MGGTLAHEMMHAWLKLQGCKQWEWERSVKQGICNVMKFKWLEWFCSSSDFDARYKTNEKAQYARTLKEYIVQVMEWSEDKVYGEGFRDAMRAVELFGFDDILRYIVNKGKFPRTPGEWGR
uniref:protein DA1-like n=1 Tax=Fragaria vesca subsp. vesca TaxID=101020 RepID=UPI0005CA4A28|nr:PREDICTED: protein DA1-like [Fragaria vesca subsp. vesca]